MAADIPLQEVKPLKDYPIHIDIDKEIIDDGGADDNFFLLSFSDISPVIHKRMISIKEMTIRDIREWDNAEIWNKPDKQLPGRPSFYCLVITR